MKTLMLIASLLVLSACNEHGPNIPTCFVMEDLTTEYCIPFSKEEKDFLRQVEAGDYAMNPHEKGVVQKWVEDHKNKK